MRTKLRCALWQQQSYKDLKYIVLLFAIAMLVCFYFLNIPNAKLLRLKFLKVLWDGVWKQENMQKFNLFWQN